MTTPNSINGYTFTVTPNSVGTMLTVVAHKDDHEGQFTHVFTFLPEKANELASLIAKTCKSAKDRRKAMRKAQADQEAKP